MKKILLSLFGIITLGLINFSSAGTFTKTYTGSFTSVIGTSNFSASYTSFFSTRDYGYVGYENSDGLNNSNVSITYSCTLSNFISSDFLDVLKSSSNKLKAIINRGYVSTASYSQYLSFSNYNQTSSNSWSSFDSSNNSITFNGTLSNSFYYLGNLYFQYSNSTISSTCSYNSSPSLDKSCVFGFDYYCTITYEGDYINSSSSDCSTVEGQLTTCQSSLSTCQSDLNTCQNNTPECDDWTQLQCESEYNLIPESSITSEYCEEEFNLIDPEDCPASGGSGDVNWSSFFVNSHQIQGASNIYLWLPDFLNWDYTYIDSGSTLEINVENEGDQDYIQGIIDINSYRPTNEEFIQSFVGGLTLLMPYIVIVLFVVALWGLIKKIFKH